MPNISRLPLARSGTCLVVSCACFRMTGNSAVRGPFPVMVKQAHDTKKARQPRASKFQNHNRTEGGSKWSSVPFWWTRTTLKGRVARPPDHPTARSVSSLLSIRASFRNPSFSSPLPSFRESGRPRLVGPTTGWFNLRLLQVEMCPS